MSTYQTNQSSTARLDEVDQLCIEIWAKQDHIECLRDVLDGSSNECYIGQIGDLYKSLIAYNSAHIQALGEEWKEMVHKMKDLVGRREHRLGPLIPIQEDEEEIRQKICTDLLECVEGQWQYAASTLDSLSKFQWCGRIYKVYVRMEDHNEGGTHWFFNAGNLRDTTNGAVFGSYLW